VIKIHFAMKTLKKSKHGNVGVRNEDMSPLHGGVAGTCFRVRDSTRSNSHRIMV
jgi:hypothetical protein